MRLETADGIICIAPTPRESMGADHTPSHFTLSDQIAVPSKAAPQQTHLGTLDGKVARQRSLYCSAETDT
jgi:hypothetical protein